MKSITIPPFLRALLLAMTLILGGASLDPALALDLDEARQGGLVGERPDGLIGAVAPSPGSDVAALVAQVNAARLESYRQIATKNNTRVDAVQAIAGQRQIEKAKQMGWYTMSADGNWSK